MSKVYDVIIIGGGPAGLTAGLYTGRAKLSTLIIEKEGKGSLLMAKVVENYPGIKTKPSGKEIYDLMKNQCLEFNTEFLDATVLDLDPYSEVKTIKTNKDNYFCKNIIIATGTGQSQNKKIKGENEFLGNGVSYCATCDGLFTKNKTVTLVGQGEELAEESLFLTKFAEKIKIFVTEEIFKCDEEMLNILSNDPKITINYNSKILEIKGNDGYVDEVRMNVNNEEIIEKTNFVFLYLGTKNNRQLYSEFADISEDGFLITDENMRIRTPNMFAIGDIRKKEIRQVTTATSDGTIAAISLIKEMLKKNR